MRSSAQVPLISGHRNARAADPLRLHRWAAGGRLDADRRARYAGGKPGGMIPVVAEDPARTQRLTYRQIPGPWFTETRTSRPPSWRNEVTLPSRWVFTAYEPGRLDTALSAQLRCCWFVALADHLTTWLTKRSPPTNRRSSPKRLGSASRWRPFRCLCPSDFDAPPATPARDWFVKYLGP